MITILASIFPFQAKHGNIDTKIVETLKFGCTKNRKCVLLDGDGVLLRGLLRNKISEQNFHLICNYHCLDKTIKAGLCRWTPIQFNRLCFELDLAEIIKT